VCLGVIFKNSKIGSKKALSHTFGVSGHKTGVSGHKTGVSGHTERFQVTYMDFRSQKLTKHLYKNILFCNTIQNKRWEFAEVI